MFAIASLRRRESFLYALSSPLGRLVSRSFRFRLDDGDQRNSLRHVCVRMRGREEDQSLLALKLTSRSTHAIGQKA
jgi:hypothetical protein